MEKRLINPWTWQDNFGFSQAIEFKKHERVLYALARRLSTRTGPRSTLAT